MYINPDDAQDVTTVSALTRQEAIYAGQRMSATEAGFLVQAYYQFQDQRLRANNQVRELEAQGHPADVIRYFSTQHSVLEAQAKRALKRYVENHTVGEWLISLHGIGPVIAAGLLSQIDIRKAPTAGCLWSYAGLSEARWVSSADAKAWVKANGVNVAKAAHDFGKKEATLLKMATTTPKGKPQSLTETSLANAISRRPWNAELKQFLFHFGESMVKFSGNEKCFYGHIFLARKDRYWKDNLSGKYRQRALDDAQHYDKSTAAYAWASGCYRADQINDLINSGKKLIPENLEGLKLKPGEGDPMLPPAHIHARARRYTGSIFLSHLHRVWWETEMKEPAPKPFVIEHLGHAHVIRVPNYKSPFPATYDEVDFYMDAKYLGSPYSRVDDGESSNIDPDNVYDPKIDSGS